MTPALNKKLATSYLSFSIAVYKLSKVFGCSLSKDLPLLVSSDAKTTQPRSQQSFNGIEFAPLNAILLAPALINNLKLRKLGNVYREKN